MVVMFLSITAYSQETDLYKYKSMFTLNFIRYIGWTNENKEGDFVITVLNDNRFAEQLTKDIEGKKFGFQPFIVKNIKSVNELTPSQILYISNRVNINESLISTIKQKNNGKPSLIIGETNNGIKTGVMINFIITNDKLKFEVNIKEIEKSGLSISNSLTGSTNAIVK